MRIVLSSWCRGDLTPSAFCDLVSALGLSQVALDSGLAPDYAKELKMELHRRNEQLTVSVFEPPRVQRMGVRSPRLASRDRDEIEMAVRVTRSAIDQAYELGARFVVLRLGAIDGDHPLLASVFARREPIYASELLRLRLAYSPCAVDSARFALEPLLRHAEDAGLTICLANRKRWHEIPSEAEIDTLLDDFHGAPLAACIDLAALHVKDRLGLASMREYTQRAANKAAAVLVGDACGLKGGLPWGQGELDADILTTLAKDNPQLVPVAHFAPGITRMELASAVGRVNRVFTGKT